MQDQPLTMQDGTQLDSKVVKVMRAIRQVESGDDYNAVGDNGDARGAYQFNEKTGPGWKNLAKQYLGDENAAFDKGNQNKVAYKRIKEWKDSGLQPDEIAALWNGAKKVDGKYTYNKPEYGQKFREALLGQVTTPNVQPTGQLREQSQEKPKLLGSETLGDVGIGMGKSALGLAEQGSQLGDWVARNTMGRAINAVQGKGFTAPEAANSLANVVGGQEKLNEMTTPTNTTQAVSKVAGNIILPVAAMKGVGLLDSLITRSGTTALESSAIRNIIKSDLGPKEALSSLKWTDKADILKSALRNASAGERPIIEKALEELGPRILKEAGVNSSMLKKSFAYLSKHPVAAFLGLQGLEPIVKDTIVGIYNKYVGNQISGPSTGNTITINPAP